MNIAGRSIPIPKASLDADVCPVLKLCQGRNLDIEFYTDNVCADFWGNDFVTISQAAAIAQIMKDRSFRKLPGQIRHPRDDTRRYMERMNFYKLLGVNLEESFTRRNPDDRFIPMESLEDEHTPSGLSDKLKAMVEKHAPNVDESVLGSLHMAFGEIMDNAVQHSDSPSPGIATAQYYPSKQYIELCVVDGGKGVVASLRENPAYHAYDDDDLAVMAFEKEIGQYVGRPDYANNKVSMGRGLYIASRIVSAMGGRLWMVSRDSFVEVSANETAVHDGFFFPGTLVTARLPVRPGIVVRGCDINDKFASSPISWSVEEGGLYYTDGNEENMLW